MLIQDKSIQSNKDNNNEGIITQTNQKQNEIKVFGFYFGFLLGLGKQAHTRNQKT